MSDDRASREGFSLGWLGWQGVEAAVAIAVAVVGAGE